MCDFDQLFKDSTKAIPTEYFLMPIADLDPIYRERVYCYELYYQLKKRWDSWTEGNKYNLAGEVDKARHKYAKEIGSIKPDFLVHTPGHHDNYLVIEVKAATSNDILQDIEKLKKLKIMEHPYKRAMLLIYGELSAQMLNKITDHPDYKFIELWLHKSQASEAHPHR